MAIALPFISLLVKEETEKTPSFAFKRKIM